MHLIELEYYCKQTFDWFDKLSREKVFELINFHVPNQKPEGSDLTLEQAVYIYKKENNISDYFDVRRK